MSGEMWAKVIGIVLLIGGILGFFMQPLFGFLSMNTLHAVVWVVVGAIYAWAGFAGGPVNAVNKWLGVILILVGLLGFTNILSFLALGPGAMANNIVHLVVGAISAWLGWKS